MLKVRQPNIITGGEQMLTERAAFMGLVLGGEERHKHYYWW